MTSIVTQNGASSNTDSREALFNDGAIGPIEQIQVSTERITQLRGILFDLDPHLLRAGLLPSIPQEPASFFSVVVAPWLERHPVLAKAEVRNSGTGLHAILHFGEPVVFATAGDRERWTGIVEVVQAALPIDPDQPGITAVTRAVGSINGKNSAKVEVLKGGTPVTIEEVLTLYEQMRTAPFETVFTILTGSNRLEPCPVCKAEGSALSALDRVGRCYGSCGNVKLAQLYDLALASRNGKGGRRAS